MNCRLAPLIPFILFGCAAVSNVPATDTARNEIENRSRGFSAAYIAGDIDRLVEFYTTDGIAAPGGSEFVRGHDSLRRFWDLPEGRTVLSHRATPVEIVIDGDHAYDWGYYEGQAAQDGEPLEPFRGKYLIVWVRGEDGVWRMAADMWNSLR